MSEDFKTLVIGSGPSGWSVLKSLENLENIWLIDGGERLRSPENVRNTHLALKMKFGSSHPYAKPSDFDLLDDSEYQLPISLSRGGLSEVWGAGFTPFNFSDLGVDIHFSDKEIQNSMSEILNEISFSYDESELNERFPYQALRIAKKNTAVNFSPRFRELEGKLKSRQRDNLLIGPPSYLLDASRCTSCGLCLTGCPYGLFFDAGEEIDSMISRRKLSPNQVLSGQVRTLRPDGNQVLVTFVEKGEVKSAKFSKVILSAGAMATAIILMRSGLIPKQFDIPDSQVFYSGLFVRQDFKSKAAAPNIANLVSYPRNNSELDFQMSLYPPSNISRERISSMIPLNSKLILKFPTVLTNRILPIIGSLPQSVSGVMRLTLEDNNKIRVRRLPNLKSKVTARSALDLLSATLKSVGVPNFVPALKLPDPGSGFHLGASLPISGDLINEKARLRTFPQIQILDTSILPVIPPGAHTFLTMALIRTILKQES